VLRIKKRGYKALLLLAERVELLLGSDVRETLNENLKYNDIEGMLNNLILYHKREEVDTDQAKRFKVADECLNVNQYISIYSNKLPFKSVYNQKVKLQGKGPKHLFKDKALYKFDMVAYYKGLEEYLERIEGDVARDMNIRAFAELFLSICNIKNDPELSKIKASELEEYIREYIIASAIDVDTSLLETPFTVTAQKTNVDDSELKRIMTDVNNIPDPTELQLVDFKSQLT
jgi:hypothetical protein